MKPDTLLHCGEKQVPLYCCHTLVVGSGCAGLNASDTLYQMGNRSLALITEGMSMGTSRNTGSDKQTYYKLSLAGRSGDSPEEMAKTYLSGGGMNGDQALCEAANSARCFFKLAALGVPFPANEYGEFVGYQTDHDASNRATSCGPLTSKQMTEALERQVIEDQIPVFDGCRVVELVQNAGRITGLVAFDQQTRQFLLFCCANLVYATGGPAGLYAASVYPESQTGGHGAAFLAGAKGVNLTEWQYGIASTEFRWNLSGSYQQVLPRYYSENPDGSKRKEFLEDWFETPRQLLEATFLKGYQWPFDVKKAKSSSKIDLAVYEETQVKGRRVFLDFTRNPCGMEHLDWDLLPQEAAGYLRKSGARGNTPIQRLLQMNPQAYELYLSHGIDLKTAPLAIDVCAQHNNGGLLTDTWGQSSLKGLFVCGEAAGVFGVTRPGGSALNSTQVTSLRAAQYITSHPVAMPDRQAFEKQVEQQLLRLEAWCTALTAYKDTAVPVLQQRKTLQTRMSQSGGMKRDRAGLLQALTACKQDLAAFPNNINAKPEELTQAWINRDLLAAQCVYLSAMLDYLEAGGVSRGSALYNGPANQVDPYRDFTFQTTYDFSAMESSSSFVPVIPFPPQRELWFETVYNQQQLSTPAQEEKKVP